MAPYPFRLAPLEDFDPLVDLGDDSRQDSWTGSRLFEINIWVWRYGRAFPRTISVKDAEEMRRERVRESRRRGVETLKAVAAAK